MKLFVKDGQFYKRVFTLALPIALQSFLTIMVNMVDTIMVGKLGELELSAVSLANQFISIYVIFCMGLGMGASVLVSRYWGMHKEANDAAMLALKKTICIMLRLTVGLAAVFALITFFAPGFIMRTYGDEPEVISRGAVYLKYSCITFFFSGLSLVCTIVLRSVGKARLPLYASILSLFVNVFANYCLIFGKFGMPEMGIAGAAVATLIARLTETLLVCGYLFFVDKSIGIRLNELTLKVADLLPEYIKISIPVLISDGILAFGNNAVAMVIGRLGPTFVAANAVTAVTQQISSVMIQGLSQAGGIVTGQTLGEGDREKAQEQGYGFLGFGIAMGILSAIIITSISGMVINFYDLSPETAELAGELMIAISLIVVFQSTNSIMTKGVLRGGGDTQMLMIADNIFLWVLSIPLGILFGFGLKLTPFWIYIGLKFDQIAKAVWCVFRLRSGKWIKKIKA